MIPVYLKQYNEIDEILNFDAAFESGTLNRSSDGFSSRI